MLKAQEKTYNFVCTTNLYALATAVCFLQNKFGRFVDIAEFCAWKS